MRTKISFLIGFIWCLFAIRGSAQTCNAQFTFTNSCTTTIQFTNQSTGSNLGYNWSFGDGTPNSTLKNPSHTFPRTGSFEVCLNIFTQGCDGVVCQTVTVGADTEDPVFADCRTARFTKTADPGKCETVVSLSAIPLPTATDNCDRTLTYRLSPSSNVFPVGETLVSRIATDDAGNTASCDYVLVVVQDREAPVFNCPPNNFTTTLDQGRCYATLTKDDIEPSATDNCEVASVTATGIPSQNRFPIGITKVTFIARDEVGNRDTCIVNVEVRDDLPPSLICPKDTSITASADSSGATVRFSAPTYTDNCSTVTYVSTPASGSFFAIGTTPVTVKATDAAGNSTTCTYNVTVKANTLPVIQAISPIGEIEYEEGDAVPFVWTKPGTYEGQYILKILKLNPGDSVPHELPTQGLFYVRDGITGTTFPYPSNAPFFEAGVRYVWQVETASLIGGQKIRGPISSYNIIDRWGCTINVTGLPTGKICPGDFFTLNVQVPVAAVLGLNLNYSLTAYSDFPTAITVNPTANPLSASNPHPQSLLGGALEIPTLLTTTAPPGIVTLTVQILDGTQGPIKLFLYYNRPSAACTANQLGTNCCHEVETITINVVQVPFVIPDAPEIKDQKGGANIQEICSGDPVYFTLPNLCPSGQLPPNATVTWQSSDDNGVTYNNVTTPSFLGNKVCFQVLPGEVTINCAASTTGFVNRLYRAIIKVTDSNGQSCEYISATASLLICCPPTIPTEPTTLQVNVIPAITPPGSTLCEGDVVDISASLLSTLPYITTPGSNVSIQWTLNYVGSSQGGNQINWGTITVGTQPIIITVTVKNCSKCPPLILTYTIPVDPKPVCGTIAAIPPFNTLTEISPFPNLVYTICPGNDAKLEATGFANCIPNWEYSFNNTTWTSVYPLGTSNTIQNTNILPAIAPAPVLWPPGAMSIYYRVVCKPLTNPSGCEPCTSNVVEIRLIKPPLPPVITGIPLICEGQTSNLAITPVAGETYTWFCNGLQVGTGTTYAATKNACYWVEVTNGCQTEESKKFCLKVCEVIPIVSCPTECEYGIPMMIDACDSFSTCGGPLTYFWSWNSGNGPQTATTCKITDTPDIPGTTYTVTVTDSNGCSTTTSTFIKPCVNP